MDITAEQVYKIVLKEYPDVLNGKQVCEALHISRAVFYDLIAEGSIAGFKVGKTYRVTKMELLKCLKIINKVLD